MKIFSGFRDINEDGFLIFLKERYKNKPITLFCDYIPKNIEQLQLNPYNFFMLHEPNEFFGIHDWVFKNHNIFSGILTWNENLLLKCPNAILFTYNGRTLDLNFIDNIFNNKKTFNTTFLCGTKDLVEGHKLRHKVYSIKNKITTPNNWYYVLDDYDKTTNTRPGYPEYTKNISHIPKGEDLVGYGKRILFKDAMFNVVIENVNHANWYNKIGDNFLSKTVPIYWGCSNIKDIGYDDRGIIYFNNENELLNIVNNLTPELYNEMKPYIDHNFEIAKVDELNSNAGSLFDEFLKINNL